jgi:hypothetical protein
MAVEKDLPPSLKLVRYIGSNDPFTCECFCVTVLASAEPEKRAEFSRLLAQALDL